MLEKRETKLKALRAALIEGEVSGPPEPHDHDRFLVEMKKKHGHNGRGV
ncbi:MAG: type II toxin-antitoxin system ParD family antitoxin [Proteobacteria bacterium]|nr:type II toxin-antitoxin system ParD family antitoxin [Pseudomonadota bacterium]